ncbi:MAG: prepilin-type N-terminal cleavage/methylation domain-containing protein [Candidatus Brocadiae bacterium]|nr:prepilin-type N-terminal cleavage/methylation domain-containing protein [Candidatus Brocadiia bacterium]
MSARRGLTVVEVLVAVAILAVLAAEVAFAWRPVREAPIRLRCRNNLNQIAKGMVAYLAGHGGGRWFPFPLDRSRVPHDFNGAEWLASLYWSGVVPDPGVFVCPSSRDSNADGRDLGTRVHASTTFGERSVSYAALHFYSTTDAAGNPAPGAIEDVYPPNMPMASDDTQGPVNHGTANNGGMAVLFLDSHVKFMINTEIDLERGVGRKGGLLWQLRN